MPCEHIQHTTADSGGCHVCVMRLSVICLGLRLHFPAETAFGRNDNPLTFIRRCPDTRLTLPGKADIMSRHFHFYSCIKRRSLACVMAASILSACHASAQNIPLISGGAGFITSTKGGSTTYLPVIAPLLAAPLGNHLLVESRATILESFFPRGGGQPGYDHQHFVGLSFLQADVMASSHTTLVAGMFLTPFGTYNERLTPIWISNYEDAPLIYPLGIMNTGSSVGGMLRGSAYSNETVNLTFAGFFSAASTNEQFSAQRATGGQASAYFKNARVEVGYSFDRRLQDKRENFNGMHLWWEPADSYLRLRSEYAHSPHVQGYWIEADYRLARFHGEDSIIGRFEPAFRMQQTFRSSNDPNDGLPSANTQRADFAFNYHLPHEVRINTSYSREFSSTGNRNIWQTGLVYRFLIPTWRGK
jgi:hypothetical protein